MVSTVVAVAVKGTLGSCLWWWEAYKDGGVANAYRLLDRTEPAAIIQKRHPRTFWMRHVCVAVTWRLPREQTESGQMRGKCDVIAAVVAFCAAWPDAEPR